RSCADRAHPRHRVRRIGTTMILSSNRHLVAVHRARLLADANPTTPTPPQPGAVVNATVTTANGELEEEDEVEVGQVAANTIQVQAVVASVGTGTLTLTVQGQSLVVPLPAGLTFPASIVGQTVTISLSLADNNNDSGDDGGGYDGGTASAPYEPLSSRGGRPERAAATLTEALYAQYGRTVGGLCRALLRD